MSEREYSATLYPFEVLPDLGIERPDFKEPWQGEVLAMVVSLHRAGHFEWRQWVIALSDQIADDAASKTVRPYYNQWLAAIEKLLAAKELISNAERETRTQAWREAYLSTPHGETVQLAREFTGPEKETTT